MTGQEIIEAWEHWLDGIRTQIIVSTDSELEIWLRQAFLSGIEAAESIWRDVPGEKVISGGLK